MIFKYYDYLQVEILPFVFCLNTSQCLKLVRIKGSFRASITMGSINRTVVNGMRNISSESKFQFAYAVRILKRVFFLLLSCQPVMASPRLCETLILEQ